MGKILDKQTYMVLQCPSCGAPVHYDAAVDGFHCLSCGHVIPYSGDDQVEETSFSLRHMPIHIVDGMFDLSGLDEIRDMAFGEWKPDREWSYIINQKFFDHEKRQNYSTRKMIFHVCPHCGGDVHAFATQTIWNCKYCGNTFIKEKVMASELYSTVDIVDTGEEDLPHFAIPFSISRIEAQQRILAFAALRPKAFADQNLKKRVNELWSYFVPHQVCDASILMEVENEVGKALLFQDYVNWCTPTTADHNLYLLSDIAPWDFSKIVPFSAKFAEGDVWFDKPWSPDSRPAAFVQANTLRPEIFLQIKRLYPGKRHRINWLRKEIRSRRTVMLPVYFLDKVKKGAKAYIMVNGQTGAVACLGRGQMKGRNTLFAHGGHGIQYAKEITMKTDLLPVVENGSGIYKAVSPQEAFRKKGLFQRLLQRF